MQLCNLVFPPVGIRGAGALALSAGGILCGQFIVEVAFGHRYIRGQPDVHHGDKGDHGTEGGQEDPAEEAEIQQEQLHLVALHHPLAFADALADAPIGMIHQQILCHAVAIGHCQGKEYIQRVFPACRA